MPAAAAAAAAAASSSSKASRPDMAQYEARLQSFKAVASSSKSRKAASETAKWPHPVPTSSSSTSAKRSAYPTPAQLSSLGLFFSPTADQPDRVESYIDGTAISAFEAGDTAEDKLEAAQVDNPWLIIFNSKHSAKESTEDQGTFHFSDELLPTGQTLIEARKQTFAGLWPHDGKKGWKCTSQKLAQAGFHYEPTPGNEDTASCIYCGRTLSGWEKSDDAVHEHIRKRPECPFFNCEIAASPPAKAVEGKAQLTAPAKKGRGKKAAAETEKREEESTEAEEEPVVEPPKTRRAGRHQRTASTLDITDDEGPKDRAGKATEEDEEDEPAPMKKPTRATKASTATRKATTSRSASRRAKAAEASEKSESEAEIAVKAAKKPTTRTRGKKAKNDTVETGEEEEATSAAPTEDEATAPKGRAARAKTTKGSGAASTRKTRAATASAAASEAETDDDQPAAEGTIVVKDLTEDADEVDTQVGDLTAQATGSEVKSETAEAQVAEDAVGSEPQQRSTRSRVPSVRTAPTSRKASASSTRSGKSRLAVEVAEVGEEQVTEPEIGSDAKFKEVEPAIAEAKGTRKTSRTASASQAAKPSKAASPEPTQEADATMQAVDENPVSTEPSSDARSSTRGKLGLGQAASAPAQASESVRVFSPLPSRAKRNASKNVASASSSSSAPAASLPASDAVIPSSPPPRASTPSTSTALTPPSPQAPFPATSTLSPLTGLPAYLFQPTALSDNNNTLGNINVNLSVQAFLQSQIDEAVREMDAKGLHRIEGLSRQMDQVRVRCEEVMRGKVQVQTQGQGQGQGQGYQQGNEGKENGQSDTPTVQAN